MADGATFIASGIIDSRKDEVIAGASPMLPICSMP